MWCLVPYVLRKISRSTIQQAGAFSSWGSGLGAVCTGLFRSASTAVLPLPTEGPTCQPAGHPAHSTYDTADRRLRGFRLDFDSGFPVGPGWEQKTKHTRSPNTTSTASAVGKTPPSSRWGKRSSPCSGRGVISSPQRSLRGTHAPPPGQAVKAKLDPPLTPSLGTNKRFEHQEFVRQRFEGWLGRTPIILLPGRHTRLLFFHHFACSPPWCSRRACPPLVAVSRLPSPKHSARREVAGG